MKLKNLIRGFIITFSAIIGIIITTKIICGCQNNETKFENVESINNTNLVFQTKFNEEQYIWQYFIFPTNRTSGVQ